MKLKLFILFVSLAFAANPVFAKNDKHKGKGLPPGLEKNQQRGKPLPPGWQKKLRKGDILDIEIYHHAKIVVPLDKHGHITVSIEGHLLRLHEATRKIIKILK